jgi:hypothetical protein
MAIWARVLCKVRTGHLTRACTACPRLLLIGIRLEPNLGQREPDTFHHGQLCRANAIANAQFSALRTHTKQCLALALTQRPSL